MTRSAASGCRSSARPFLIAALAALASGVAACGGSSDGDAVDPTPTATAAAQSGRYAAVHRYLDFHTAQLAADTATLSGQANRYHALAKGTNFDYPALLADHRSEVAKLVGDMQTTFRAANPAYEEMEGVVAGVPSLADFDVILDAGGDASDPENAVPFSVTTPAGKTYEQPGNFFALLETSLWGTDPKFAAKGVDEPDLDGDGKVSFGEALPDADFLVAAARDMAAQAKALQKAGDAWTPTSEDVFTALVVMTPTMSEYFEAWKNSRFVAGSQASEKGFVAASRLEDIASILGGLQVIYKDVAPEMTKANAAQAAQTEAELATLATFVERLRDREHAGQTFSASQAETFGTDAQEQAEAIAGQVSQAAGALDIELAEA